MGTIKLPPFLNQVVMKEIGHGIFPIPSWWQSRDLIICLIGDRGDGKSLGGGSIALVDHMLPGFPCFSNIDIEWNFEVDDELASMYGEKGGTVHLASTPLNKRKFLSFDTDYSNGVIFTHEFNIWLADSRRSGSYQNLATDDISQQLRKLNSTWILDCLHEMFVDVRIRDYVDIYIKTQDQAFSQEGMFRKQPQGHLFDWYIYPMTRKGAALCKTEKINSMDDPPLGPFTFNGRGFWGLINSKKNERREKFIPDDQLDKSEPWESKELKEAQGRYGFIYHAIKDLHDGGYEEIHSEDLWRYLDIKGRGLSKAMAGQRLRNMGIRKRSAPQSLGGYYYIIDKFELKKAVPQPEKKIAAFE